MNERSPINRRKAIRGVGAALVAAAASRSFAGERSMTQELPMQKLQDPMSKYPKPPFKSQSRRGDELGARETRSLCSSITTNRSCDDSNRQCE
ncbi:MAG: hypothetical protein WAK31_18955 [Chthoniobacterales bacterium]